MESKEISAQYFLSTLSHEIRTPLNGIVGYTQLLSQSKLDKNQIMYLNSMKLCCIQLVELVNDILDFSRLATGKAQINHECLQIKDIAENVNSTVDYKLKEKKQKLIYIIPDNFPEYIVADKQKIIQVIINLVSNSIKFSELESHIIITFEYDNEKMYVSVEDNGIGISKNDQEKLFNPFFQVQESLVKNGSGLGLAICKKIVTLLGGDIIVESEKGIGSTFRFNIKYENYTNYKTTIDSKKDIFKDKFILVAESDIDTRLLMSDILFETEMHVIVCSSPKETLRMINTKR